jgi:hypothetical protein
MIIKRPRIKNEKHLAFVRSLPCLVCGDNTTTEAAHIRSGELAIGKRPTGMGEKPSDCWVIPLCGEHHREQHAMYERAFWFAKGIDPFRAAAFLYCVSGDFEAGETIISNRGNSGHDANTAVSADN